MENKPSKILVALSIIGLLSFAAWWNFGRSDSPSQNVDDVVEQLEQAAESDNAAIEDIEVNQLEYSIDDEDSLWVVVNKERPIPLSYAPSNIRLVDVTTKDGKSEMERSMRDEAATALELMFAKAATENIDLMLGSGYRDADLQAFYYNNYVATYGQAEADKFSAKPGTSEHQTGLVGDVAPASNNCYLQECFRDTPEGTWVAEHAHEFGFIVRYPKGKEDITGYQYEPWHLRYLGVDLATELYTSSQTMEEYFGL